LKGKQDEAKELYAQNTQRRNDNHDLKLKLKVYIFYVNSFLLPYIAIQESDKHLAKLTDSEVKREQAENKLIELSEMVHNQKASMQKLAEKIDRGKLRFKDLEAAKQATSTDLEQAHKEIIHLSEIVDSKGNGIQELAWQKITADGLKVSMEGEIMHLQRGIADLEAQKVCLKFLSLTSVLIFPLGRHSSKLSWL